MARHKLRAHHWKGGVLNVVEHYFENLEHAIAFANSSDSHNIKIYDENSEIVHSAQKTPTPESYA
jgi:hypothetical protein